MSVRNWIKNVDGWLTINEATLLYRLAKGNTSDGVIVEIGSWKGKSTICLGKGSQDGHKNRIYAIDPHVAPEEKLKSYLEKNETSTFDKFKLNVEEAGISDLVSPIVDFSFNAVSKVVGEIDLIFIDGSHRYEDVLNDFELFFPKLRDGGIIAFHDTNGGGPYKVVVDKLYRSSCFKHVRFVDSISYGVKVKSNTGWEKIINRYNLLIFRLFNKWRKKRLPGIVKTIGKVVYNNLRK